MFIREKDRLKLISILESADFPLEVWAYGSRVNVGAHEGSDLGRIPIAIMEQFRAQIHDSTIPILVELWDWAALPERFHRQIERRYEVLFDSRDKINATNGSTAPTGPASAAG